MSSQQCLVNNAWSTMPGEQYPVKDADYPCLPVPSVIPSVIEVAISAPINSIGSDTIN
jgi:hypothetical protein